MNSTRWNDETSERRLYIGNLDNRITEASAIKMFSPFGKIVSEEFLWHTRGPKRGEPRGYGFIQFNTKEEVDRAKMKMNGRFACGRPLVVRFASEKNFLETTILAGHGSTSTGKTSRLATIAAIRSKLKSLEEEGEEEKHSQRSQDLSIKIPAVLMIVLLKGDKWLNIPPFFYNFQLVATTSSL